MSNQLFAIGNMKIYNRKTIGAKGFTILELLVVIGILAVLITAGTVSYSTSQKIARDARRLEDLKNIQNAFEQYYAICNYKYGVTAVGDLPAGDPLTCADITPNVTVITYPKDPLGGDYQCVDSCTVSSYTICPPVVDAANNKYLETKDCTVADPNCCLKNQQ